MHDQTSSGARLIAPPPRVFGPGGAGRAVIVCEHASPHIPAALGDLGLPADALASHIAWDPGALGVAEALAQMLDAPLVASATSRLVYDCNRPPEAASAVPERSEVWDVPGNRDLPKAARHARVTAVYEPFYIALADLIAAMPGDPALITVHSFTPVFNGAPRDTEIGVLHDADARLADGLLAALAGGPHRVARNDPYGPQDGVTHTLREHAHPRKLPNVMIEIRNDLIETPAAQRAMAEVLAAALCRAHPALAPKGRADA
jgi:predicted N-formylglutamate amidohydrolase